MYTSWVTPNRCGCTPLSPSARSATERRCREDGFGQHPATPCLVCLGTPAVAAGHPEIGLDATHHRRRLDEFVERDVAAKPSAVAVHLEDTPDLPVDPGDEVIQVLIQLGAGVGAAEQRGCQSRGPPVYVGGGHAHKVKRRLGVVNGDHPAADFHVENAVFSAHANSGDLGGGDQQGCLGPVALNGFNRNARCCSDFRQRRARVSIGGEQLRCGRQDPLPGLLRLLLTQLGPVSPSPHHIDSGTIVMNTTTTNLTPSPGVAQCHRSSLPASPRTATSHRCWLSLKNWARAPTSYGS